MSIRQIIKQKTVYLTASRIELSEAEVKAMSHQALIALLDKVFTKARSDKEEQSCKLFYALESAKEDEPLELIEAFCSAKQRMDLGLTEMKMKNGRIGVNTETEDKFMSLSLTNIILNFNPFYVETNMAGLPAVPSNLKTQKMAEHFSFWEDGLLKEDTATLQKISFRSKAGPKIEGYILFYKYLLLVKQYDFWFYDAKNVLCPAEKDDKVDAVDIHLTYNYKRDERNPNRMLPEHINMDYSLQYYNAKNDNDFKINANLFFLFYDYENPFTPPFFREVELYNDYVKIWTFPYMETFWEQNYFLPQNEKREEHRRFLEKHGIIKTKEEADFKPDIAALRSPLQAWSEERVDLAQMPMNELFESYYQEKGFFDLAKFKLSDKQYNFDAQIFLNYFCQGDSLHFVTKTFINLDNSYFLPTPNAYVSAFVNMLFDLFEMSRRNLDANLKRLKTCDSDKIKAVYDEEIKRLGKNIRRFKIGTAHATDIEGMLHWRKVINDSLRIDNTPLLDKRMPPQGTPLEDWEKSVSPTYQYNTGMILLRLGQREEARFYFAKAIDTWGFNIRSDDVDAYYRRAIAYYHLGEMELFCDDLQKVIEIEGASEETTELLKLCGE